MLTLQVAGGTAVAQAARAAPEIAEVRGTWLTTTANDALASPRHTAATMQRLREIGLNTVYVEAWKNGYTQFPSKVLERTLGVAQRPALSRQDPSDAPEPLPPRDLLQEALIEAHRHGLICVAWFEYGFMAAHGQTMNHLRRLKPEWLSRDRQGGEVAPNGFVWLNPLHPQARAFVLDLMLEAIERYDLDGVQLDDRIVWPHVTMGYDAYTRSVYAAEHGGRQPPDDPRDPAWMRWRADKLNALAQDFVARLRAARPGLMVSLSPAPYPWSYENYLLEWPRWTRWPDAAAWSEFVPQAYRRDFPAFEATWREQEQALQVEGRYDPKRLVAGIRIVGDGPDSSWEALRDSMDLVRRRGQAGHVLWFSKGVLDRYPAQLKVHYDAIGPARSPHFAPGWRRPSLPLQPGPPNAAGAAGPLPGSDAWRTWSLPVAEPGHYRVIGHDGQAWQELQRVRRPGTLALQASSKFARLELLVDRRATREDRP